jgi:hypothetical protein
MTTLTPKFDLKNGGTTPAGAINRSIHKKLADTVSITDFGALGDGVADDAIALNNAIASGATYIILPKPSVVYKFATSINLTNRNGVTIDDQGSTEAGSYPTIDVYHNNPVFDCTGANSLNFYNLTFRNPVSSGFLPSCGFLLARTGTGSTSSGTHRFWGCRVWGQFKYGCVYNFGSEELDFFGSWMQNNYPGGACQTITANNADGVTSPYVTISSVTPISTSAIRYHGGSYLEGAESYTTPGSGNYTESVFRLDQCQDITVSDAFLYAKFGLAIFECRSSYGSVAVVNIHGCRSETSGNGSTLNQGLPSYFVWAGGGSAGSTGLATWAIQNNFLNQDLALIYTANDMKIAGLTVTGNTGTGAGNIVHAGYILDSRIDNYAVACVVQSNRNVYIGSGADISIPTGFSVDDFIFDTNKGLISAVGFLNTGGVSGTTTWTSGAGSPEGTITATVGSLYSRTDGSTSTSLYVKTSGSGNTGWTAK